MTSEPRSLLDELDEADKIMSQCGEPYENADLTGLYCHLDAEHDGPHETCITVRWDNQP